MTWILLEALGAGLLLVLIVWWTMFSGRERGEPHSDETADTAPAGGTSDLATPAPPTADPAAHTAADKVAHRQPADPKE